MVIVSIIHNHVHHVDKTVCHMHTLYLYHGFPAGQHFLLVRLQHEETLVKRMED